MSAPARLSNGTVRRRRRGATVVSTTGRTATAVSAVTRRSLNLCLFFRRFFPAPPGELGHNSRVCEGCGVAEGPVLGHVAQQPAHDLAGAGFRQLRREDDVGRRRELADYLANVVAQLLEHLGGAFLAAFERDEGDD